jgi:hypothetical protein
LGSRGSNECDRHTTDRIPSFAGDFPFMSMLFQACFTIIMVNLVYVLVSSYIVKDINLVTIQQYLVVVRAWVLEKGQIGQIYVKIKIEMCLAF